MSILLIKKRLHKNFEVLRIILIAVISWGKFTATMGFNSKDIFLIDCLIVKQFGI